MQSEHRHTTTLSGCHISSHPPHPSLPPPPRPPPSLLHVLLFFSYCCVMQCKVLLSHLHLLLIPSLITLALSHSPAPTHPHTLSIPHPLILFMISCSFPRSIFSSHVSPPSPRCTAPVNFLFIFIFFIVLLRAWLFCFVILFFLLFSRTLYPGLVCIRSHTPLSCSHTLQEHAS